MSANIVSFGHRQNDVLGGSDPEHARKVRGEGWSLCSDAHRLGEGICAIRSIGHDQLLA